MSFNITIDYRFDTSGFFDNAEAKAALEAAADAWEALINDEFDDVPAGSVFTIANPSDRSQTVSVTLDAPIDDLLLFAGAYALNGPLGLGGYNGTSIDGDVYKARVSSDFRGTGPVTDFEPYVGTISFDTEASWNFDTSAPVSGQNDFYSVAMHEIAHVLGIGTAPIFESIGAGGTFDGVNALAVTGNAGIPLESDISHVTEDYANDTVLMDPSLTVGDRTVPTTYDLAMLADIGYEIDGYTKQGSTPDIVTEGADVTVFGTILGDFIDGLGGADKIQGDDGTDTLLGGTGNDTLFGQGGADILMGGTGDDFAIGGDGNDTLRNSAGDDTLWGYAGVDTFEIRAQGGGNATISDFDLDTETIRLIGSGFASGQAAVDSITKVFSNVSIVTFSDGTKAHIFHDSQGGSPLTAAHFDIVEATPFEGSHLNERFDGTAKADIIEGFGGNDTLIGNSGNDSLYGGDGADTLNGGDGDDVILCGDSTADLRDAVFGGNGNDSIHGGYGNDELRGDAGDDSIEGGYGVDIVIGGAGNDVLTGSAWSDQIFGGADDDFINGGFGFDRVNGGTGADKFYHTNAAGHGSDWIQDYSAAEGDVLMYGGGATSKSDFLVQYNFTPEAGADDVKEAFITHVPSGNVLWALVDGAGQSSINVLANGQTYDLLA
jgi:Ca2+-binding RTX toxin-like protein